MSAGIRVLVADDHPVYRSGLVGLLTATEDMDVVAEAGHGREAVDLARLHQPDVAVLDLAMPSLDGIEATREMLRHTPEIAVLILTMHDGDDRVFQAMQAGARGYVVKSAAPDVVIGAIRAVAQGGAVLSAALTDRMADWFETLQRAHGPLARLTPRERDVLRLMAHGRDNASISEALGVSPKTVRNVVSAVFVKLQVTDRAAAVALAREAGLT